MGSTRRAGRIGAALLATAVVGTGRPAAATPMPASSRYASIVIESETGAVLYERNADLPRFPASLTKIMTLYLTFEALEAKRIALTDAVTISAHAAGQDPSRLNLAPNSKITVEEAIRAMTTKSANDAACAVAERLGSGSEARFADAMSRKARTLGLIHTTYSNASGLPSPGHVSSARDLAMLCKALVHDFPAYYHYFSMGAFEFHGTRYPNQNRFLRTYYGADGIKTGFVNASGHNLAASAVRGGKRLIAIVLGGDSQAWTREHATRLLDISYAKIDPSLVMVASNAPDPGAATETEPAPGKTAEDAAPVYSTGAGAVTVASAKVLPLAGATANLAASAATAAASPVTGVDAPPASSAPESAPLAAASAAASPVAVKARGARSPSPVAATPAPEKPTTKPQASSPEASARTAPPAASAGAKPRDAGSAAAPRPTLPPAPPAAEKRKTPKHDSAAAPAAQPVARSSNAPPEATTTDSQPEARTSDPTPGTPEPANPAKGAGDWSVQVGLFRDATVARRRGEEARSLMPLQLRGADLVVGRALDGVHITSRISRLSEQDARAACNSLQRGRVPCVVVPPGRPLVVATN